MIYIRKSHERGHSQHDWLDSFHTFSFAEYYDPGFMGFGHLRVINEDRVQPGNGFGKHPHRDMEIISYVIDGSLEHKDSMGTGSVIKPNEIQIMSAGTGVEHSEFNHSKTDLLHFLQIWIIPEKQGLNPSYQQKSISKSLNQFILIGSRDADDSVVKINQDMKLFSTYLTQNNTLEYSFNEDRAGWVQVVKGKLELNGNMLSAGDGAAIQDEKLMTLHCIEDSELLLFDLIAS